jgi:hypothetical protein
MHSQLPPLDAGLNRIYCSLYLLVKGLNRAALKEKKEEINYKRQE